MSPRWEKLLSFCKKNKTFRDTPNTNTHNTHPSLKMRKTDILNKIWKGREWERKVKFPTKLFLFFLITQTRRQFMSSIPVWAAAWRKQKGERTNEFEDEAESVIRQLDMCHWYAHTERFAWEPSSPTIELSIIGVTRPGMCVVTTPLGKPSSQPFRLLPIKWNASTLSSSLRRSARDVLSTVLSSSFVWLVYWTSSLARCTAQYRRQTRAKKINVKRRENPRDTRVEKKEKKITNESDKFDSRFYLPSFAKLELNESHNNPEWT